MDGEAGWWTTSWNIGLPPLARAMGVGRQQHETDDDNVMEDIIVGLPANQLGHEDNIEEEDSRDELDYVDVGTASDSNSDEWCFHVTRQD